VKRSTLIWLGIIGVLVILLCTVWTLILAGALAFPVALSLLPTDTPTLTNTPIATSTATPTTTPDVTATPSSLPSNTPTPTSTPASSPTPPPPFPTPQSIGELEDRPLRIGYMSNGTGDWDIFVAAADGSDPQNISNDPGFDAFPAWSPYSDRLAWVTNRFGQGAEVVMADIDGNKLTNISNQVNTDDILPVWSPNGQLIAYISNRFRDSEVFVSLPDGTAFNLSNNEAEDIFFDWSPTCLQINASDSWDQCRALIGSNRTRGEGGFPDDFTPFLVDADGSNLNVVLDIDLKVSEAIFSPNGTQVAYLKRDRSSDTIDLYLLDLETKEETRLTEDEVVKSNVAWSPKGDLIAYVAAVDEDPNDIYVVAVTDGDTTLLTDPDERDVLNADFAWSPEGDQILFSTLRDGNPEIYVMDADGSNPTNLTETPSAAEIEAFWIQ